MARGKHQSTAVADKKKTVLVVVTAVLAVAVAAACLVFVIKSVTGGRDKDPGQQDPPEEQNPPEENPGEEEPPEENPEEDQDPPEEETPPEEEPPEENPPEEPVYTGPVNPLTGLPVETDISANRPFAVMLNNIRVATPQAGVGSADMIIETLAEGGITRLMGIYQDFKGLETIGSVRSARPYYVELAMGFDAFYIHAGGSNDAYAKMKSLGIDRADGVNSVKGSAALFYRDSWRRQNMGYAHSLMLDVTKVADFLTKNNIRTTHKDGFETGFTFAEPENPTGDPATYARVWFGSSQSSKSTAFRYDPETKLYGVSQYGAEMKDSLTGGQVKVRNILALRAKMSRIAGDDAGRMQATLSGTGEGVLISDGVARKITWSRKTSTSQFVFTDETGAEIVLSPGVTYITISPTNSLAVEVLA